MIFGDMDFRIIIIPIRDPRNTLTCVLGPKFQKFLGGQVMCDLKDETKMVEKGVERAYPNIFDKFSFLILKSRERSKPSWNWKYRKTETYW